MEICEELRVYIAMHKIHAKILHIFFAVVNELHLQILLVQDPISLKVTSAIYRQTAA